MDNLENLLNFLFERREDERLKFSIEKRLNNKIYYIYFTPDEDPSIKTNTYQYRFSLLIQLDQENNYISLSYGDSDEVILEDNKLLNKWCDIINKYINGKNYETFNNIIENAFNDSYRKDFHRDWKIKKLFDEDNESI